MHVSFEASHRCARVCHSDIIWCASRACGRACVRASELLRVALKLADLRHGAKHALASGLAPSLALTSLLAWLPCSPCDHLEREPLAHAHMVPESPCRQRDLASESQGLIDAQSPMRSAVVVDPT